MSLLLPANSRVLLVEDQPIIAMDVEFILSERGVTIVDTATTAIEAQRFLATAKPDAAVLDLNLGAGTSLPVAEDLLAQGIPFIFTTGYGDNSMIPEKFAHIPLVSKPYESSILVNALARAIADVSAP